MSKCAALIKIGWFMNCFEADDPCGIIRKVEEIQDFDCLMRMGQEEESGEGQKELAKLQAFLDKYYDGSLTLDDIKDLNIELIPGDIVCLGVAENEEEIASLKGKQGK